MLLLQRQQVLSTLQPESRSVVEEGFQCLCFLLYLFLPCFEVYTIQATSTSFPSEKNLVCESRQFVLDVEVATQIIIWCFIGRYGKDGCLCAVKVWKRKTCF